MEIVGRYTTRIHWRGGTVRQPRGLQQEVSGPENPICLVQCLQVISLRAIQWSWLFFAFPCLLIAYIGQAAHLYDIPSAYTNPFFSTVPPGSSKMRGTGL